MTASATEAKLLERWYDASAQPGWLWRALAAIYRGAIALRTLAYRLHWAPAHRLAKPVVIVGNLTVGGTGKTPLVVWLAQKLQARGLRVGIVSRGYGRTYDTPHLVELDSNWQEVGDEPLLLRRRTGCATMVGRDRVAAAEALIAYGVDVILADDGLQHLRLARDCEIVVVDGSRGFGNGRVLPAGPLREPPERALRVDLVVLNGPPEHSSLNIPGHPYAGTGLLMSMASEGARRVDGAGEPRSLDTFRGQRVHAVAGIGNPDRFFRALRAQGIEVIEHPFADHHPFVGPDLSFGDSAPVLMTEKDAVKCREFADPRLWYVPVSARFGEAHERLLLDRVMNRIRRPGD
ncbi:MAG TPA: tetraacyldisaccharide 4'-kinase [Steroidobacteraceae bacterium]|jgi:tetraacyldisaccharide 4'-kinase